jgi:serine/threonine protein kinase
LLTLELVRQVVPTTYTRSSQAGEFLKRYPAKATRGDNVHEERVALPAGTVISGRYIVKNLLDTEDSSVTYLVDDQHTMSELFALKEVSLQSKRELYRFLLELQLLTRLNHPALIHIYTLLKDDKHCRAYILMEHIEGPNLETLLLQQPEQRFSLPEAMTIMPR